MIYRITKKNCKYYLSVAVLALLLGWCSNIKAQVPTTCSKNGKLRAEAKINGDVIDRFEKGDSITILNWYIEPYFKAVYNGQEGFISDMYIKRTPETKKIQRWGGTGNIKDSTDHDFSIIDDKVEWQRVYNTSMNYTQLIEAVENSAKFETINVFNNKITGSSKSVYLDYKALGYARMSTQILSLAYEPTAFVLIEYKDGRYRVTLKDIKLVCQVNGGGLIKGDIEAIEDYAIKKEHFRQSFINGSVDIYNYSLEHYFDFKPTISDDNW